MKTHYNILIPLKKSGKIPGRYSVHDFKRNWDLYLIILLPVAYIIVFKYLPMYGAHIAFKDYMLAKGIGQSPWVGLKHFNHFFDSYSFLQIMGNTIELSIYSLLAGFPVPVILALMLNYCTNKTYKKTVQLATYAPHFISTVVMVGIIMQVLSIRTGVVNLLVQSLGGDPVNFLSKPQYFSSIYVWTNIWQRAGWGSIIYLAALSSVDIELHESAIVFGANKIQRIWHIDLPSIMPTIVIMLILSFGQIMNIGFEKVLLMQNPLNLSASEVIQTYVYKVGISSSIPNYSYASAIGLFLSVISFVLLITVNRIARKVGETSLW